MLENLSKTIDSISKIEVSAERKVVLQPLVDYIQNKVNSNEEIRLNFICTHNSRRSHLSQLWAHYRDWETDRKSTRLNSSHRL